MAIERVREYFKQFGIENKILEFSVSSATVQLAAEALGCEEARIAKTLSFKLNDGTPILIVTAGDAKVDNARFKEFFGCKAKMIAPAEVEALIGHAIGGVCPFGINENVKVYLDISLNRFKKFFPACGSDNSAIGLSSAELEKYAQNAQGWYDLCKGWKVQEQFEHKYVKTGKKLGVLGGLGPAASAEFMRQIAVKAPVNTDQEHAVVYLIDDCEIPDRTTAIFGQGESPLPKLKEDLLKLCSLGVDVLAVPCNTAHFFIDQFKDELPVPLVHIIEETVLAAQKKSPEGAWMLSTTGTRKTGLYQKCAEKHGFKIYLPNDTQAERIMQSIVYVKAAQFDKAGKLVKEVVEELWAERDLPVMTACTEIPLGYDASGLPQDKAVSSLGALSDAVLKVLYKEIQQGGTMNDRLRLVALGEQPADLILKNGKIVDVFTESVFEGDVAIVDGYIAAVGSYDNAKEIIDVQGQYIAPGLINAHCHVESSMATPEAYVKEELRWGVTTLITDPHEIANVMGTDGIHYMLQAGSHMPINYYVEAPSCVPATPFEHSGCIMHAAEMAELLSDAGVLGLGEMMNVPGVLMGDAEVMKKLKTYQEAGRVIDGHAPCVTGKQLQGYISAGIDTDHESISWDEAKEKLRSGLAVLVREGSACHNLKAIIEGAVKENAATSRMAFCTDDKHLADIKNEGTIRHSIQLASELGMKVEKAIAIGSLNAARIYGLKDLGAVATGYQADLVVFNNLEELIPSYVFHKGQDAWKLAIKETWIEPGKMLRGSVNIGGEITAASFGLEHFDADKTYSVIEMVPGEIYTERGAISGADIPSALAKNELCLIAVVERHHATGNIGLGLIRGYGIRNGAAATTVGHDSHNLLVVGTNPENMVVAVHALQMCQGGYTLVENGEVVDTLPLDICGLMSSIAGDILSEKLEKISNRAYAMGVSPWFDPFISLSFMALPVIPKLRITDIGLFDAENFKFIS